MWGLVWGIKGVHLADRFSLPTPKQATGGHNPAPELPVVKRDPAVGAELKAGGKADPS